MIYPVVKQGLWSLVVVAWASVNYAQQLRVEGSELRSLSLYGLNLSEITPEVEKMVAIWANPIIVTIPEGQTPREAALQACPNAGDAYLEVFQNRGVEWNPHLPSDFDINNPLTGNHIAIAPNCIQSHSQRVIVGRGEWVERDLANNYLNRLQSVTDGRGRDDEVAVQDFAESVAILNNRDLSSLSSVQEGERLIVPLPRVEFETSAEGAEAISLAIRNNFEDWSVDIGEPYVGGGGSSFTVPKPPADSCSGKNEGALLEIHSRSFAKNYEAIFWNMKEARRIGQPRPQKAAVAILDTGLPNTDWWKASGLVKSIKEGELDTVFLPKELSQDFSASATGLFALSSSEFLDEVSSGKIHTETVLGAALGGYYGYLFNASFGVIEPSVYSIFELGTTGSGESFRFNFAPRVHQMEDAIETIAEVAQNVIVNVSAGMPVDRSNAILEALIDSKRGKALFVVAAGNSAENAALDGSTLYPANYGGRNAEDLPLITVGGYQSVSEGKPTLWKQSNRGEHVDLLALGCDVQTVRFAEKGLDDLFSLEHSMGTSLAAPSVTFTAALIQHLLSHRQDLSRVGSSVPMVIKHRLLSAADLHPDMERDVVDGRVLNLSKAVNVFSDVVEFSNGETLRGEITFQTGNSPIDICGNGTRVSPSDVRKIAQWRPGTGQAYKIYFTTDRSTKLQQCTYFQIPRMQFTVSTVSGGEVAPILLDDFRDIVFSMPKL